MPLIYKVYAVNVVLPISKYIVSTTINRYSVGVVFYIKLDETEHLFELIKSCVSNVLTVIKMFRCLTEVCCR